MRQKVDALEMWSCRKMLKINFRDRITNKENAYRITFLEGYDDAENEICWTCIVRISQGIAPTDSRGASRRYKETGETKRYMNSGYAEMDGKENLWRVEKGSGR